MRIACWVYLPMIGCAVFVRPPGGFHVEHLPRFWMGLAAAFVVAGGVVAFSRWAGRHTQWGRELHREFRLLLGGVNSAQVLALSLLSGFGEEIVFRGVLQPRLGWLWATLLFGALHFPLRRALIPWSAFALAMGLVLAGLTEWANTLWPAILLHFMVNFLNLHQIVDDAD